MKIRISVLILFLITFIGYAKAADLEITITVPEAQVELLKNAMCFANKYKTEDYINGTWQENSVTENQFVKNRLKDYLEENIGAYQNNQTLNDFLFQGNETDIGLTISYGY